MEKSYRRVSNIDEIIKDISMPYLQWKVLFLVNEDTSESNLKDSLPEEAETLPEILDFLLEKGLIELASEVGEDQPEAADAEPENQPAEEIPEETQGPEDVEESEDSKEDEDIELKINEDIEEVEEEAGEAEEEIFDEPDEPEEEITEDDVEIIQQVDDNDVAEEEIESAEDESEESEVTEFMTEIGEIEETGQADVKASETEPEEAVEEEKEEAEKQPEPAPEVPDADAKEDSKDKKTIMVVDDSIVIRKMVEIALEEEEFNIVNSNSGKEAINLLDSEEPQLVILDMMLPDMNGIDLLKTIKASKGIPVIMLSGKDAPQLIESAKEEGADDFLPKPFKDEDLVEKVKSLVK